MFKGKRVFISGGNGVIGNCLVRKLHEQGAVVFTGDLKARPVDLPKEVLYRQGDLNFITKEELENFAPEYFFHLAATFERSAESYSFWDENFQHNVKLSNHLMSCLKDCPSLKKVVFASSYLIYDPALYQFDTPASTPYSLKETDPIYPRNLTGVAKLSHEIELRFINEFKKNQYKIVSARIYRGHGLNSRDIISRWARTLINDESASLTVYRKEGMFDYIFSEDSAEGLLRLAASEQAEGIINLGTGKSRRVADVLAILQTRFPKMTYVENEAAEDIPYEASQSDNTLLKHFTGWSPEYTLEQSVNAIVDFEEQRGGIYNHQQLQGINVLVTSISKKVPLLQSVKHAMHKLGSGSKLFGGDVDSEPIGKYFVDEFWNMPRLKDELINDIIYYCTSNNIRLIIPTRDGELAFWALHKQLFLDKGISIMVSGEKAIENTLDKLRFFEVLQKQQLPAIYTSENQEDIKADSFVVKERYGAGALNIGINLSKDAAATHARDLSAPIFQPFVKGKEYSVDAFITKTGRLKGVVTRARVKVVNGESQITVTEQKPQLEELCNKLVTALQVTGHIVLQVLEDDAGNFHIIECNARFGGASTLSVAAGLDSFYWALLEVLDNDLSSYPFIPRATVIKQIRFAADKLVHA
ncbi:ATP-grasp domain-containing protein [Chitinophaga sp. Ak27]|uniref:ATP-grasp domain-containing protein n=1 Tax=Chitinophaga sp. Ak27 TaxID=2726116 RepID=UPI00145EDE06|nr:ATP-grasp domain-containing protein [Chitinophaga sp. Ak27]NLU94401.1 NAD-dependent epimerase/dehydratase family protein [Chitinophaga sp. Ak27]